MIVVGKDYGALVARLPLVPIENDKHVIEAHSILVELSGKEMTRGESQYFDVLARLTAAYEKGMFPGESMTPREVFEYLLEENGLTQAEMGKIIGCRQGRVSEILAGTRDLSKEQIARLSAHFKVSANLFLSAVSRKVS